MKLEDKSFFDTYCDSLKELTDSYENGVLSDKEFVVKKRGEDFKSAVLNGKSEEFLLELSEFEKKLLKCELVFEYDHYRFFNKIKLSKKYQRYLEILNLSIEKELYNQAISKGFSSIEEYKAYNEDMKNDDMYVGRSKKI